VTLVEPEISQEEAEKAPGDESGVQPVVVLKARASLHHQHQVGLHVLATRVMDDEDAGMVQADVFGR
jgi:hypothetical protein